MLPACCRHVEGSAGPPATSPGEGRTARRRRAEPRIADPRNARAAGTPLFTPAPRPAGEGTPTSGQSSRWGPAQRPAGPRRRRPQPAGWLHSRRVTPQGQDGAQRSAGLRPASRGSAKPALMTPGPANVSPAPPHAVGVNGPTRSCGFLPVEASGRHRPPEAGEGLAFHPHVGRTPGEPRGPAPSYQISPTVKPSGKGSDGSTEYWAIPVIQAVPLIVGTTAGTPPTVVVRIRRPTNSVPTGPK